MRDVILNGGCSHSCRILNTILPLYRDFAFVVHLVVHDCVPVYACAGAICTGVKVVSTPER
jgi:hypothetical protein